MATGQYIGVNGVARKVTTPYIGVEGVARKVTSGYVGVNGVARLFFAPDDGIYTLKVKKIISNTYANDTTYNNEEFVLLDIYPKSGGTVNVTFGGLTKTIADTSGAEEPNAQQVYFGTFNGVSDEVETPESGKLIIEGDWYAVGCSQFAYESGKLSTKRAYCITKVGDLDGVTIIPNYAFYSCSIDSCIIPDSVKQINTYAFAYCKNLTEIVIPQSVLSIRDYAFRESSLTNVELQDGVTSIGLEAFAINSKLKSFIIPNTVKTLGLNLFMSCAGLESLFIPESVEDIKGSICKHVDRNNIITVDSKNKYYKVDGNCLIEIASNSLLDGFVDSVIPSYVTKIGGSAFAGRSITNITIPNGVTEIGADAFFNCTKLISLILPASVTSIGFNAFGNCLHMTEIKILATTPPLLDNYNLGDPFSNNTATIIVPAGCGDTYKSAENWSNYADRIVEAS